MSQARPISNRTRVANYGAHPEQELYSTVLARLTPKQRRRLWKKGNRGAFGGSGDSQ